MKTAERILEVGRRRFNAKGYAATTLTQIAEEVGISQGNLTYHFPTKKDLVLRLVERASGKAQQRRDRAPSPSVADDYVEHLVCTMNLVWENRFIFRDKGQFEDLALLAGDAPAVSADFDELYELLGRMDREGMFRRDLEIDLLVLTRALWVVSRYWMDHLLEFEGLEDIAWADQERGVLHHFAVLSPNLLSPARKQLYEALTRFSHRIDKAEPNLRSA